MCQKSCCCNNCYQVKTCVNCPTFKYLKDDVKTDCMLEFGITNCKYRHGLVNLEYIEMVKILGTRKKVSLL